MRTTYRTCPFCEATCGLAIDIEGERIVAVRGDQDDVFSRGFICPKAHAVKELHHDPDRIRRPLRRTAGGWEEVSWDAAFAEIAERLTAIRAAHGPDAVGVAAGNPIVVHDLAFLYLSVLAQALGSRNIFNPTSVDTLPKDLQTGLMYGGSLPVLSVAIPDIDRTDHLLIIGANPAVSHGSLMTMPNAPGRLKAVRKRGGKVVVIDPRRTETAKLASEHHFIRPGTDGAFLLAMIATLFDEGLVRLGAAAGLVNGLDEVRAIAQRFLPETVAAYCGIDAPTIRRIAREFASARSAACYGRLGTCVQPFGTLASWGVDLMNILSGNLDRPGGVMFTSPAAPYRALGANPPFEFGRWRSRVSGRPEASGMLPLSTMVEEIMTPGAGQIRAMILLMTNVVRSAANSNGLEEAFRQLDFVVAVDCYLNETTRHAHLILPTPTAAETSHYDFGLYHLAVRNIARYSPAPLTASADTLRSWEVLARISAPLFGMGQASASAVDDVVFSQIAAEAVKADKAWPGLTLDEVTRKLTGEHGPERIIDLLIRLGPHGDGFGRNPAGYTLDTIKAEPHGIDLGPLVPRLREVLNTASGRIELVPQLMVDDLPRLQAHMATPLQETVLIGRRVLRASNSFMHNLPLTTKGPDACTLQIAPQDAARIGVSDGDNVLVSSRVGEVVAQAEVTSDLMAGVVSLPHGYGHAAPGTRLSVANARPGVNINALTDDQVYDEASGCAVFFGVPVAIAAAPEATPHREPTL
jgi:anaerobic selenocysteine-containing dehydrogenase